MGGETDDGNQGHAVSLGLSPRGRGNLRDIRRCPNPQRSIPAWAGKPIDDALGLSTVSVYPRVGGETCSTVREAKSTGGLSPRGRGNRVLGPMPNLRQRSIPAWAGKPPARLPGQPPRWVYPRVGGETSGTFGDARIPSGLSPRGRGNLFPVITTSTLGGSIPAWAGKPPKSGACVGFQRVYPRVGGETEITGVVINPNCGLSPRGRGNHVKGNLLALVSRSIPAWAGKPSPRRKPPAQCPVYPRVGGETLGPAVHDDPGSRSIPAWAGKPPVGPPHVEHVGVYPRVGGETWGRGRL